MMSDYDRTMELVEAANDSAGSSQKQFEKTMESLESKLNVLANAWNEFTMGIANNQVIKTVIDLLSQFVTTINNLTDSLGDGISGFLKLSLLIGGLSIGKALFNSIFGFIKREFSSLGSQSGKTFSDNFVKSLKGIKKGISKEGREYANLLATTYAKELKQKKINSTLLKQMFDDSDGSAELAKNIKGLVSGVTDGVKGAIDFSNLNSQGQRLADNFLNSFVTEVKNSGKVNEAITILENQLKSTDWKKFGATNITLGDTGSFNITSKSISKLKISLGQLGTVAITTGLALGAIAEQLEASGYDEAATSIKAMGTAMSTFGMVTDTVSGIVAMAGKTIQGAWGPIIAIISGAIGIITSFFSTQSELSRKAREEKQKQIDQAKELSESAKEEQEAFLEYENLYIAYQKTGEGKEDLIEITKELTETYGIEIDTLDLLADSYDEVNKKILKAREASLKSNVAETKQGLRASEDLFLQEGTSEAGPLSDREGRVQEFSKNVGRGDTQEVEIVTQFKDAFLQDDELRKFLYEPEDEGWKGITFDIAGIESAEDLAKSYEKIQEVYNNIIANPAYSDIIDDSVVIKNIEEWLESNKENYENYIQLKGDLDTYNTELASIYTNLSTSENLPKIEDIDSLDDFEAYRAEFIKQLTDKFKEEGIDKTTEEIESIADKSLSEIDSLSNYISSKKILDKMNLEWNVKLNKDQTEDDIENLVLQLQREGKLDILANVVFPKGVSLTQIQDYVQAVSSEMDAAFAKQAITDTNPIINSLLESGNLDGLDEKQLSSFTETMGILPGVYNKDLTAKEEWDTLSKNAGSFEQIQYLTDLQQKEAALAQQSAENSHKALQDQIDIKQATLGTLIAQKTAMEQEGISNPEEYQKLDEEIIATSASLDELKTKLDTTDWSFEITASGTENILNIGDALIAQSDQIKNAAMLIGEGFTVATEDAQQLANIFPELMENAEVLSDGTIKLSAETVNAVLGDGQEIVNGDIDQTVQRIDTQIGLLESKKASAEAELEIAKAVAQGDVDIDKERVYILSDAQYQLTEYLMQLGLDESEASAAVAAAMSGNMEEYNRITAGVADDTANNLANSMASAATATWENSDAMINSLDSIGQQAQNVSKAIAGMAGGNADYKGKVDTKGGSRGGTNFFAKLREGVFTAAGIDDISAKKPNVEKWISDIQLDISGYTEGIAQLTALKARLLASKNNSNLATDAASSGAGGKSPFEKDKGGKGGKGGSSGKGKEEKEEEKWENTYDWLYNLTQDINEQLRIREKLEKKYDRLLQDTSKSASDLQKNLEEQLNTLEKQRDMYQEMYNNRKEELKGVLEAGKSYSKYATYNWKDNTVEIDWAELNKITDKNQGEAVKDYISQLEEIESKMDDAEDALDDIIDEIEELQKVGKDEYDDLESRVLDALVAREQEKIDKLSLIDESINDANSKLIDSIQSNLDKIRQDRQNEETEQSIEDNERRLAYLQQDTSGANALEIQKLQEELATQKQDYTDTLIDQKLSAIQEQNDKASEERQYQIELAQAQLEEMQKNGEFWNEAYRLIKEGTDATGKLVTNSALTELLKDGEAWESMSNIQKMDWLSELENTTKAAMVYFSSQRQLEKIGKTSGKITFTNANGEKLTGTVQKDGSVKVSTNKGTYTYKDVFQNYDGTYRTLETNPDFKANPSKSSSSSSSSSSNSSSSSKIKIGGLINAGKAQIYDYVGDKSGERQYFLNDPIYKVLDEKNGYLLTRWHKLNTGYTGWFKKSDVKAYAKGGLADFTGPAWLDGTKSKPELVLNARDTENFIQLKDILSNLLRGDTSSGNSGDNYFEIHIDVDSLNNDYDVEQLATKIKKMINDDARYRNVNSINLLR